jgi:hypothetical protein
MTESGGAKAEVSFRGRRLGNVDGLVPRLNALEDETITNFRSERRAQQLRNLAANGWQVQVSQRGSAPQDLIRLVLGGKRRPRASDGRSAAEPYFYNVQSHPLKHRTARVMIDDQPQRPRLAIGVRRAGQADLETRLRVAGPHFRGGLSPRVAEMDVEAAYNFAAPFCHASG